MKTPKADFLDLCKCAKDEKISLHLIHHTPVDGAPSATIMMRWRGGERILAHLQGPGKCVAGKSHAERSRRYHQRISDFRLRYTRWLREFEAEKEKSCSAPS